MSLRTAYPTFFRLIPALPGHLVTAARFAFHLLALRWWSWRLTRRLLLGSAVLTTFLALFYTVENWRGRRALAAATREAAAINVSFDLRTHAQHPVPDDQNLAKLPLFDAPADPTASGKFWSELSTTFRIHLTDIPPGAYANASSLPSTGRPNPLENTPADLAAFRAELEANEKAHETLDAFLARTAPLLAELGGAAAHRPFLIYDHDWDDPMSIIVPYASPLRDVAHAASVHALVQLANRQPAAAATSLALPFRLRTAIQRDPLLISQLTAVAIDSITLAALWQGQITHAWTAAELDLLAPLLADDHILQNLRRSCAAETAWSVSIPLQLPRTIQFYPTAFANDQDARLLYLLAHWAPYGWLQQNAASSAFIHLRESLPAIDPGAGRLYPDRIRSPDQRPRSAFPPYDAISRISQPNLRFVFRTIGVAKTRHDLARLALALEKHLLAHSAYPESLAPILASDPALAALHDPYDGQPYRYRRDADGGFTLWGIGQNLRDDGGTFPDTHPTATRYETGDLVWRVPAS